jgi:hypothetical protein
VKVKYEYFPRLNNVVIVCPYPILWATQVPFRHFSQKIPFFYSKIIVFDYETEQILVVMLGLMKFFLQWLMTTFLYVIVRNPSNPPVVKEFIL